MTFAFKAAGVLIEIVGDTLLPESGEHPAALVNEAFVASLSSEARAERGVMEVIETERPVGVTITGMGLVEVDGVPTREFSYEPLSPDDLESLIQRQHDRIDAYAGKVITDVIPLWKQQNLTDRAVALLDLASQRDLTSDETAERTAIRASRAWIDAVRAHSDALKAALPADGPGAAAFDLTAGWPAFA